MVQSKPGLIAGKILRQDYIGLKSIDDELPFVLLDDKEVYLKLGECRDIVTNFRPTVHLAYNLKQQLLRVLSDYLYSTSPESRDDTDDVGSHPFAFVAGVIRFLDFWRLAFSFCHLAAPVPAKLHAKG